MILPVHRILRLLALGLVILGTGCTSSSSISHFSDYIREPEPEPELPNHQFVIKTTAYCHFEADSQPYGKLTARGNTLRCEGPLRSAAADWSRYPVGTRFRIIGHPQVYEVDDYGSALVGTDTIDIYQPTLSAMRAWGAPTVGIEVLHWGSFQESAAILGPRAKHSSHVREMLEEVKKRIEKLPARLEDGFPSVTA